MLRYRHLANTLVLTLATGCASPTVDMGDGFGWNGTEGVHLPWALGSAATLTSHLHPKLARKTDKIEVRSSDKAVFAIDQVEFDETTMWIDGTAVGVGTSNVVVTKGNRELGKTRVEVTSITSAGLVPAVAALDPTDDDPTTLYEQPRVIVDGEAHFRVQFYDNGTPVFGGSIAEVDAADSLDLHADSSYLDVEGKWISVRPTKKGVFPVTLQTDGEEIGNLEIEVVSRSVIDRLELIGNEPRSPAEDQPLRLVLNALDVDGEPLFGAPVTWLIDGHEDDRNSAEVFRYTYYEDSVNLVEVELGKLRASETIHGYPDSSCTCDTSTPAGGWLFAFALICWRTRRLEGESAQRPPR